MNNNNFSLDNMIFICDNDLTTEVTLYTVRGDYLAKDETRLLYEKLKRNLSNPEWADVKKCLIAHGFTVEQNSGKSTHFTISTDVPNFFDPMDNRTIVVHSKNLIRPYGKRAIVFIERMKDYEN